MLRGPNRAAAEGVEHFMANDFTLPVQLQRRAIGAVFDIKVNLMTVRAGRFTLLPAKNAAAS